MAKQIDWVDTPMGDQFQIFDKLIKQGWKIELEQIVQLENGEWLIDDETNLPIPNQVTNAFAFGGMDNLC